MWKVKHANSSHDRICGSYIQYFRNLTVSAMQYLVSFFSKRQWKKNKTSTLENGMCLTGFNRFLSSTFCALQYHNFVKKDKIVIIKKLVFQKLQHMAVINSPLKVPAFIQQPQIIIMEKEKNQFLALKCFIGSHWSYLLLSVSTKHSS